MAQEKGEPIQRGLLVRGAHVLELDANTDKPPVRDVLIRGNRIEAVSAPGQTVADLSSIEVLDATGKLMVPGLVNAHYHSYDTLHKGRFENQNFDVWALHSQPGYYAKRSREELRIRTLLGALECIRSGITTIQDMNSLVPQDEETLDCILGAYKEAGIRTVFSISVRDVAALDIAPFCGEAMPETVAAIVNGSPGNAAADLAFIEAQLKRCPSDNLQHWALSPSGPQRCTTQLLEGIAALSERFNLPVLTHAYETRAQLAKARAAYKKHDGSIVRYLDAIGLLNRRLSIAHGVYLTRPELQLMADRGAGLVHNPISNLKLKNGVAPLADIESIGINLALGCDNNSCSDCQNLFQVMKTFALLGHATVGTSRSTALSALRAATLGGARALGLEGEIGALKPGMRADLVLLDLNDYAYLPLNSAVRQLVYSESGRAVDTVIVDGKIVLREGKHTLINEDDFRRQLVDVMGTVDRDYASLAARHADVVPWLTSAQERVNKTDLGMQRLLGHAESNE